MTRRTVIAVVLACLGLPAVAILADAVSHVDRKESIVSSGQRRDYLLHVPASYDAAKPVPLVVSLHPAMSTAEFQQDTSRWNRLADERGFIVVYPQGEGGGPRMWLIRGTSRYAKQPDVVFISDLLDALQSRYNIDPARIYANGLSNGGGMSFALSCTLSHRFAAVGAVAAAETLPWEWCRDDEAVPMIAFHGTADRITPYRGGKVWISPDPFPDIPGWTEKWAKRNGCASTPVDSRVASDVMRREYASCASDASVVLYSIEDGGHTWPGGMELPEWLLGRTTRGIDATQTMWAFFQAHPRR